MEDELGQIVQRILASRYHRRIHHRKGQCQTLSRVAHVEALSEGWRDDFRRHTEKRRR